MEGNDSLDYEGLLALHNRQKKENRRNTVTDFGCEKFVQKEEKKVHVKVL